MTRALHPTFKRDRALRRSDQRDGDLVAIGDSESPAAGSRASTNAKRAPPGSGSNPTKSTTTTASRGGRVKAPPPPSERWVTRFHAFKCVHLDPMSQERLSAQLAAQLKAQADSAAQVDYLTSQREASGGVWKENSFTPKPSRTADGTINHVAAFLAAVAGEKLIRKTERSAKPGPKGISVDGEDSGSQRSQRSQRSHQRIPQTKPLVSRRDARAPSPSPPCSGDEAEDAGGEKQSTTYDKDPSGVRHETEPTPYAYASTSVPSLEELGDVMARLRALRPGSSGSDHNNSNAGTKKGTAFSQAGGGGGSLEAYHGSLALQAAR